MSKIILEEQTAPSTPGANLVAVYPKAGGRLYYKDDAGIEIPLNGYAAQAWAEFAVDGTLSASFNITSITDTGPGDWTANLTTGFTSTLYCAGASCDPARSDGNNVACGVQAKGTAASFRITCEAANGGITDPTSGPINIWAFGDQ